MGPMVLRPSPRRCSAQVLLLALAAALACDGATGPTAEAPEPAARVVRTAFGLPGPWWRAGASNEQFEADVRGCREVSTRARREAAGSDPAGVAARPPPLRTRPRPPPRAIEYSAGRRVHPGEVRLCFRPRRPWQEAKAAGAISSGENMKDSEKKTAMDRREFMMAGATAAAVLPGVLLAAKPARAEEALVTAMPENAPMVAALQYVSVSTEEGKNCGNCQLYTAGEGKKGKCQLFMTGLVEEAGYCASWAQKVS